MQVAKIDIWLVGVVLVATPIFCSSLAVAQPVVRSIDLSGDQVEVQPNPVLELQELRAEIAELRDMIERQQYQIRQLQSQPELADPVISLVDESEQPENSPSSAVPLVSSAAPSDSGIYSNGAIADAAGAPSRATQPAKVINSPENTASGVVQVAPEPPQVAPQSTDNGESGETFYRPYEGDTTLVDENPEVVSAARQSRQANKAYPPVVERPIVADSDETEVAANGAIQDQTQNPTSNQATVENRSTRLLQPGTQAVRQPDERVLGTQVSAARSTEQPIVPQAVPDQTGVIPVPALSALAETAVLTPPVVPSEDVLYQQGFEMLKQFKYDEAVNVFKQQIDQYPQGGYADDAHYWIAESMYLNRNLPESKRYFRSIIDGFADSPRVPDAMLKTAYIEQEQGNEIEARILLQEIIQYHPRSDAAISAKNRLEKLN